MANEQERIPHKHLIRGQCIGCGEDAIPIVYELEQQLAQEQKNQELTMQEWQRDMQDYRAAFDEVQQQLAQARALLQEVVDEYFIGNSVRNLFKKAEEIRAFLAREEGTKDE